jgi:glycosyltransferase involved in cell wall biosynthesis
MTESVHIALNAHLLSGAPGYRSAGIHTYIYNTLAHLPQAAPDLRLTALTGRAATTPDVPGLDVRRSAWDTSRPMARVAWEQLIAPFALAGLRPDLVHGMAFATPIAWPGPSVVTVYDLSFVRYPGGFRPANRIYLRLITRVACRRARRVIAISESGKAEIGAAFGLDPARIDVAQPGVGEAFGPLPPDEVRAFRAAQGLPERFILYLGTIEPRKNLETLLHAYAHLPQRADGVGLVIAGGRGWLYERVFGLIEQLGLAGQVITAGYVEGESLPMWYNAATVFAYPSLYEGFGLPVIEAVACGTPVVASHSTSLPEAVGPEEDRGGLLAPPTDVEAWVGALSRLLDDAALREELGERGRARAARFTWQATAQKVAASYRRALREG